LNENRFLQSAAVAALCLLTLAVPASARGDVPQSRPKPTPNLFLRGHQKIASLDDAFDGLGLTEEQKTEVQKIRRDTDAQIAVVAGNQTLDKDHKDAMIERFTRLEYSQIFRALTPAQQQVVRERIRSLQAAEAPGQKPNASRN
jgi:Spy/CpxP family protein refolding chaperone